MSYVSFSNKRIFGFLFFLLILSALAITGCRKEEGPGSVGGTIHPYTGALSLSLHEPSTGEQRHTTITDGNGKFVFADVDPGEYILRIKTSPLYRTPEGMRVSVSAYKHTDLQMLFLAYNDKAQQGTVNFLLDGASQQHIDASELFLHHFFSHFHLQGTFWAGPTKHSLFIGLSGVSDTGTFAMAGQGHQISVAEFGPTGEFVRSWSTMNDSLGSASITLLDPVSRTASGTFNCTMSPNDSIGPVRKVSGVFSNVLY